LISSQSDCRGTGFKTKIAHVTGSVVSSKGDS